MTSSGRNARIVIAVLVGASGLAGCAAVKAADNIRNDITSNRATITSFTNQLQSTPAKPFRATYVTTGSSPATIAYAVQPPNGLSFTDTAKGAKTSTQVLLNSSGAFDCQVPIRGSKGRPTCQKLGTLKSQAEQKIFDIYTPSHWITFLRDFSLAAGFAGDRVTSSTKTVNGFSMSCVDFVAGGVAGKSTICSTSQGLLGYVKVASDNAKFEISSYTASPAASTFTLPRRAKVTKIKTSTR